MNLVLVNTHQSFTHFSTLPRFSSKALKTPSTLHSLPKSTSISLSSTICSSSINSPQNSVQSPSNNLNFNDRGNGSESQTDWNVQVGHPAGAPYVSATGFSLSDRAFFLLAFIACSASIGFASFVIAAASALHAMGKAAVAFSKLADTACEELPSTMAAVRLSSMEISDLTLELNDLSQEIADGVNNSAEIVQGVGQLGSLAHHHTMSMIEERATLPIISIKPVATGAATKTSHALGQATRAVLNILSRGKDEATKAFDRFDLRPSTVLSFMNNRCGVS